MRRLNYYRVARVPAALLPFKHPANFVSEQPSISPSAALSADNLGSHISTKAGDRFCYKGMSGEEHRCSSHSYSTVIATKKGAQREMVETKSILLISTPGRGFSHFLR